MGVIVCLCFGMCVRGCCFECIVVDMCERFVMCCVCEMVCELLCVVVIEVCFCGMLLWG